MNQPPDAESFTSGIDDAVSLDALTPTIGAYRTCEFATLARDGTPLTWPTVAQVQPDGTLLVTTALGFPQKALNVRRDGRVALLFSDPTGSELAAPAQILITGTAGCPEEIVVSPAGLEGYWGMLAERQSSSGALLKRPTRWLMDWYYMRLLITVTPTRISSRPALTPTAEPSGVGPDSGLIGAATLARYSSAVLGAHDQAGGLVLLRTHPVSAAEGYRVDVPDDAGLVPGPASLLVHRHGAELDNLENALIRGQLAVGTDGWVLTPERLVEPSNLNGIGAQVKTLRRARRSTRTYLKRRGLARPKIRWDEFQQVVDSRHR